MARFKAGEGAAEEGPRLHTSVLQIVGRNKLTVLGEVSLCLPSQFTQEAFESALVDEAVEMGLVSGEVGAGRFSVQLFTQTGLRLVFDSSLFHSHGGQFRARISSRRVSGEEHVPVEAGQQCETSKGRVTGAVEPDRSGEDFRVVAGIIGETSTAVCLFERGGTEYVSSNVTTFRAMSGGRDPDNRQRTRYAADSVVVRAALQAELTGMYVGLKSRLGRNEATSHIALADPFRGCNPTIGQKLVSLQEYLRRNELRVHVRPMNEGSIVTGCDEMDGGRASIDVAVAAGGNLSVTQHHDAWTMPMHEHPSVADVQAQTTTNNDQSAQVTAAEIDEMSRELLTDAAEARAMEGRGTSPILFDGMPVVEGRGTSPILFGSVENQGTSPIGFGSLMEGRGTSPVDFGTTLPSIRQQADAMGLLEPIRATPLAAGKRALADGSLTGSKKARR